MKIRMAFLAPLLLMLSACAKESSVEVREVTEVPGMSVALAIADEEIFVSSIFFAPSIVKVHALGGDPIPLVAEGGWPFALATDGTRLYWSDYGDHTLRSIGVDGGNVITLAANEPVAHGSLAIGGGRLFWIGPEGSIRWLPIPGGAVTVTPHTGAQNLVVAGNELVWVAENGWVWRAPLEGGEASFLAHAPDAPGGGWITADDEAVYWTTATGVWRAGLADGVVAPLASGRNRPWRLATGGGRVYWGEEGSRVAFVDAAGGAVDTIEKAGDVTDLHVVGSNVIWSTVEGDVLTATP